MQILKENIFHYYLTLSSMAMKKAKAKKAVSKKKPAAKKKVVSKKKPVAKKKVAKKKK